MTKKRKSVKAWAIMDTSSGFIWESFIRLTRRQCIEDWCYLTSKDWKTWYREGRRCVRVTITVDQ